MSFVIKIRGTPTRTTIADYYCEEHGRFELEVDRTPEGDAPDIVPCPHPSAIEKPWGEKRCGLPAVFCISAPLAKVRAIEAVRGKDQKPEFSTWTDTRNLMEGQPLYEWKEDREKVWEEKRKRDVMRMVRES